MLDAIESRSEASQATGGDVEGLLHSAAGVSWEPAPAVGEGEEYRVHQGEEVHASELAYRDAPVHFSVVVAG